VRLMQRPHSRNQDTPSFLRVILRFGDCRHNLHRVLTESNIERFLDLARNDKWLQRHAASSQIACRAKGKVL